MSKSEKFWNKTAEKYAKSKVSDEATYQKKLAETVGYLTPDMHVLEFGCGTGTTAIHHAPRVKQVDAIDIADNMLEIGRVRAKEKGVENIQFTRGTLQEFNADTASIDAVLGLNVIHLVPDRRELIAEVARVLKPNGVFVTSTVCLGDSFWRHIKLAVPLGKLIGLMPDLFIIKADELVSEIKSLGFTIENRWHHGSNNIVMFLIVRKI